MEHRLNSLVSAREMQIIKYTYTILNNGYKYDK